MGTEFEEQDGQLKVLNTGSRGRESENRFECGHRSRHLWRDVLANQITLRTRKESLGAEDSSEVLA